jgi:hypothetical protein
MNAFVTALVALAAALSVGAAGAWIVVRRKHIDRWLFAYLRQVAWPAAAPSGTIDILVCVADHYEPAWLGASLDVQRRRVDEWVEKLPALCDRHRDSDGCGYRHSFFFPAEEYQPDHLDKLAHLCRQGFGDVEVHLHHDRDTAENLRRSLLQFTSTLHERHGLLRKSDETGQIEYAFIHGNWALDNSMPDGSGCGVNDEITVLRDTGCYLDMTFPSAPSPNQPPTINSIYYATDDPRRPNSHAVGVPVRAGAAPVGDLMLIQGPLTLNWRSRVKGIAPRIENGELTGDNPPTPERADLWIRQGIHVANQPNWVFVKLHTHGAQESNAGVMFGAEFDRTLSHLERRYNDGVRYRLHYVTAREMYLIAKAAEAGCTGNAGRFRNDISSAASIASVTPVLVG